MFSISEAARIATLSSLTFLHARMIFHLLRTKRCALLIATTTGLSEKSDTGGGKNRHCKQNPVRRRILLEQNLHSV